MELLEINEDSMTKQQIQRRKRANKLKLQIFQKQQKLSSGSSTNEDSDSNSAILAKYNMKNKQNVSETLRKQIHRNHCNGSSTTDESEIVEKQYKRRRKNNQTSNNNKPNKDNKNKNESNNSTNGDSNYSFMKKENDKTTATLKYHNCNGMDNDETIKTKHFSQQQHQHTNMVDCPNKCGEKRTKKKLAAHTQSCVLQITKCEFHAIGCPIKVVRNMMKQHNDVYANIHNLLIRVQKLDEAIEKLKFDGYLMQRQFHNSERKFLNFIKRFEATKI